MRACSLSGPDSLGKGQGVEKDLIGAATSYELAADHNFAPDLAEGQTSYASCLANSRGIDIDLITAAEYLRLAVPPEVRSDQSGPMSQDGDSTLRRFSTVTRAYNRRKYRNIAVKHIPLSQTNSVRFQK
jgi:hypothetical protein